MAINTYATTGGVNATTPVDPTKKKLPNLPYLDANDPLQIAPLTNTALNQPAAVPVTLAPMASQQPSQGSSVLGAAQSQVLSAQNTQNPLAGLITQKSTDLLNNTYDATADQKYKQNQLENFDYNNAMTYESLRQKNADISNTGLYDKNSLNNQLQSLRDRGTLETTIDTTQAKSKSDALLAGLASARETNAGNQTTTNSAIDNLAKVYGMENVDKTVTATQSENALSRALELTKQGNDIAATTELTNLQAKIASGQQLTQNEWQSVQNNLNRQLELAKQAGDINAVKELETLKGTIQQSLATNQNTWQSSESAFARALELTTQSNDIQANTDLTNLKAKLDSGQQIDQNTWQAAQNGLDRQAKVAEQAGDIQAQKDIETLKSNLTMQQMIAEQNYEGAQNQIDRDLQTALQSNDINATKENLQKQLDFDKIKEANGQTFTAGQSALNRTLEVSLKTLDINSATDLANLKAKLDSGLLTQTQDWDAANNALTLAHETAIQQGDIAGQFQIEQLRGQIETAQQTAQQEFSNSQRIATQGWQSGERISDQDFQTASKYIDSELQKKQTALEFSNTLNLQAGQFDQQKTMANITAQLEESQAGNDYYRTTALTKLQSALESGRQDDAQAAALELKNIDVAAEKYLQNNKASIDLQMQTNGMAQETKMAYLEAQLDEAKANGDVGRQQQIITYQTTQDIKKIEATGGIEAAQMEIKNRYDLALQKNDIVSAEAMKKLQISTDVSEAAKNRVLAQIQVDLESKKVDMAATDAEYQRIMDQVDAGTLEPDAGYNYLMKTLKDNGVNTSGDAYKLVDQEAKAQQAIEAQYNQQKQQFLLTHPDSAPPAGTFRLKDPSKYPFISNPDNVTREELIKWGVQPSFIDEIITKNDGETLSTTGMQQFDAYLNKTLYGEMTAEEKAARLNAGYLGADDLSGAQPGEKYAFSTDTKWKDVSGKEITIPAGRYSIDTKVNTTGSDFFGKTSNTHIYLVDSKGDKFMELKASSAKGNAGWTKMADPVLGIWDDVA